VPITQQTTYKLPPPVAKPEVDDSSHSDDWEALRGSLEYHLLRSYRLSLYQAPLMAPQMILDIGCSSGQWARIMAQNFPAASIIGIDEDAARLLPITFPVNCHFLHTASLASLPFADQTFDYTHLELLTLHVPWAQWHALLREALRVTKAGGWIEVCSMDLPRISHPVVWIWIARVCRDLGFEVFPGKAPAKWLAHVGAHNITCVEQRLKKQLMSMTTSRVMIVDGIALLDVFRKHIIERAYAREQDIEQEIRVMQHNLLRTDREESLPIITVLAQP
jgi:SAM-dependent methyltransferase